MEHLQIEKITVPYNGKERTIRIYLPDEYFDNTNKHFPVLYMHDGQNLFEDALSFSGHSWRIQDTLKKLRSQGKLDGLIVVGIDNDGENRLDEYSPWVTKHKQYSDKYGEKGGNGDLYSDFLVFVIKPFIDKKYRTLNNYENTLIAGSSMGGVISAYIAARFPSIFSKVGIFSLASWFCEDDFNDYISSAPLPPDQIYYVYVGDKEGNKKWSSFYLKNSNDYVKILLEKIAPPNIEFEVGRNAKHCEKDWAKYFEHFLLFAFK